MNELIEAIRKLTDALPDPADREKLAAPLAARDWAGFFAAIADLMAKLAPLLIPLFVATTDETK